MFDILDDEVLGKVSLFEYYRGDGRIPIRVTEFIAGKTGRKYAARPDFFGETIPEHIGRGDSEEEALKACVDIIRDVDVEDLISIRKSSS